MQTYGESNIEEVGAELGVSPVVLTFYHFVSKLSKRIGILCHRLSKQPQRPRKKPLAWRSFMNEENLDVRIAC